MKNKKGMIYGVLLMTCLVIGLSYGAFIFSTDKYRSSELLISKLNYSIDIQEDGSSKSTINGSSVTVPASTKVYLNITLTSVNEIDSKYTLAYKTSTNVKVQYSDRTPWNTQGIIKGIDSNTYSKKIRVVIDNTEVSTPSTVNFQVYGGYSFNSYANIELTDGYVSVSGPYTEVTTNIGNRLVDIIESDTSCLTSNSNTCLYGGENIKNYVQYPEDNDKTKNLWRIIGSYQIDDQTLPKLISQSTSSTSTSSLTTDLTSFYNTLQDKEVLVQETNKFNCFTNTCAESTYNNIGLLTDYEYNQIGGVNSYLISNENYYINTSTVIKEVTSGGITNPSNTSGLKPTIYLQTGVQVTGSGTVSDPYIISPASDINLVSYTLDGQNTDKTYEWLSQNKVVDSITCQNGSVAEWDYSNNWLVFKTVKAPDYCTLDFKDGYTVTVNATNGTVSAPVSKSVGNSGSLSFTVTPNSGYIYEGDTCNGTYSGNTYTINNITSTKTCNITFKFVNPYASGTLGYKILEDNPTRSTRDTYNAVFTNNTTGTLFTATEKNVHNITDTTVYYYAGNTTNNWVKFAGYYWRIIRTNADGSVRLLYSGTEAEGTTGTNGMINTSTAFNSSYNSPKYAGYMYGENDDTLANARTNTKNSTIKDKIDTWYAQNMTSYTKYLSTTAVYCNDRTEQTSGTYNTGKTTFYYAPYARVYTNYAPTYDCTEASDAFSVDNTSAKLTYPIALMTVDEIMRAGGKGGTSLTSPYAWYYLNSANGSITSSTWWWLLSPSHWGGYIARVFRVYDSSRPGYLSYSDVDGARGVRPVLSLKADVFYKSGDGTANSPYEIVGGTPSSSGGGKSDNN